MFIYSGRSIINVYDKAFKRFHFQEYFAFIASLFFNHLHSIILHQFHYQ
jgi:hypothetical protein